MQWKAIRGKAMWVKNFNRTIFSKSQRTYGIAILSIFLITSCSGIRTAEFDDWYHKDKKTKSEFSVDKHDCIASWNQGVATYNSVPTTNTPINTGVEIVGVLVSNVIAQGLSFVTCMSSKGWEEKRNIAKSNFEPQNKKEKNLGRDNLKIEDVENISELEKNWEDLGDLTNNLKIFLDIKSVRKLDEKVRGWTIKTFVKDEKYAKFQSSKNLWEADCKKGTGKIIYEKYFKKRNIQGLGTVKLEGFSSEKEIGVVINSICKKTFNDNYIEENKEIINGVVKENFIRYLIYPPSENNCFVEASVSYDREGKVKGFNILKKSSDGCEKSVVRAINRHKQTPEVYELNLGKPINFKFSND